MLTKNIIYCMPSSFVVQASIFNYKLISSITQQLAGLKAVKKYYF